MGLQAGGNVSVLQKDAGSISPVLNFNSYGSAIQGPKLTSPANGAFLLYAYDGPSSIRLVAFRVYWNVSQQRLVGGGLR